MNKVFVNINGKTVCGESVGDFCIELYNMSPDIIDYFNKWIDLKIKSKKDYVKDIDYIMGMNKGKLYNCFPYDIDKSNSILIKYDAFRVEQNVNFKATVDEPLEINGYIFERGHEIIISDMDKKERIYYITDVFGNGGIINFKNDPKPLYINPYF